MKSVIQNVSLCAAIAIGGVQALASLPTGYEFDITTHYSFTAPADLAAGPSGNPDTGYLTILNAGSTSFTGLLDLLGVTPGLVLYDTTINSVTLNPGDHLSMSLNDESSNQGGYIPNGPGNPQFGAQLTMNGDVTDGTDTEHVLLQVFDGDIHSGVPRLANGTLSDSYVLQGGDPFGGDTGDGFEVEQADGHFKFLEVATHGVPDSGSTAMLLGAGLAAMSLLRRRLS